jgi:hypothetical protein
MIRCGPVAPRIPRIPGGGGFMTNHGGAEDTENINSEFRMPKAECSNRE